LAGDLALTFDFLRRSPQQVPPPEKFARLRALRFFADFEEPELWEIVNAADWLEPAADSEIVREGDLEASFYVLVEGSVAVTKSGSEIVRLGPGDCFGEMALVSGRRRSASIRTMSTTHIIRLRSSIVDRMSVNAQLCFQRNFLAALVERLESTTGNLAAQNAGSPMAAGD
jgi:CRP-like cAMP-binding protein